MCRLSIPLTAGFVLAGLVACGSKQTPATVPVTSTATRNAPAWIDNEEIPDGLAAVGIAQPNALNDKSLQRTEAVADARVKLGGKIKVRVQNLFSQLNQQVATADAETPRKPIRSEVLNRIVENVTRQLVDQELSGTSTRHFWNDPADGNLYVFVVMTRESLDHALAGAAQGQIRKEISQGEPALERALGKLDAAIAASGGK